MATPKKPGAKRGRPPTGRAGKKLSIYAGPDLLAALQKLDTSPAAAAVKVLTKTLCKNNP